MLVHAKRIALATALIVLPGCVLLSGANQFDKVDDALEPETVDDGGSRDEPTDAGSKPNTLAPGEEDAPAPGTPPPVRPNAGVYTYTVEGSDAVKGVFSFGAKYGPTATVKIEHLDDGCFNQIITLREGYVETMHECIVGTDIVQDVGVRAQKFPLVGIATTNLVCKPGDAYFGTGHAVNQVFKHTCDGSNSDDRSGDSNFTTAGSYRFVGEETLEVKGLSLPVLHYRDDRQVTGKQTGANTADWYFSLDGVLVKLTRDVNITYPSVIGTVNYLENVKLTLDSLPQ